MQNKIKGLFENLQNIVTQEGINNNQEVAEVVSAFIKGISASVKADTGYKGDIGEALTAAIVNQCLTTSLKAVKEAIVVGTSGRSQRGLDTNLFVEGLDFPELINDTSKNIYQYGDFIVSTQGTQADKVDVSLRLKSGSSVGLSVKN